MKFTALISALLGLNIGCAAIVSPSTDRLRVVASPGNAQVRLDDEMVGQAPITVRVPKRRNSFVEVTAPGYQTATCDTTMTASGGYIAADIALCVLLFPVGCISFIDAAGFWNHLENPHCNAALTPDSRPVTK